jgi:hypothetical protein
LPGEPNSAAALARVQEYVIWLRVHAIYFMASGWLPAVWTLRGKGELKKPILRTVNAPRGRVVILSDGPHKFECQIINETNGIETLENSTHFVEKALALKVADIRMYLDAHAAGKSGKSVGGYHG